MYCVSDRFGNDFYQGASLISIHAERLKISDAPRKQNDSIWYCCLSDSWVVCKAVSKVKESLKLLLKSSNHLAINHNSLATNTDSNFCKACSRIWPAKYWPISACNNWKNYIVIPPNSNTFFDWRRTRHVSPRPQCVLSIMPKVPKISVGIQMGRFVSVSSNRNIRDHLWRWSTYFGRNIPTKFTVPFLTNRFFALIRKFGKII